MTKSRGIRSTRHEMRVRILLVLHKLKNATPRQIADSLNHKDDAYVKTKLYELHAEGFVYIADWCRRCRAKYSKIYAIKTDECKDAEYPEPLDRKLSYIQYRSRLKQFKLLQGLKV